MAKNLIKQKLCLKPNFYSASFKRKVPALPKNYPNCFERINTSDALLFLATAVL